jgi:hypothetical protein
VGRELRHDVRAALEIGTSRPEGGLIQDTSWAICLGAHVRVAEPEVSECVRVLPPERGRPTIIRWVWGKNESKMESRRGSRLKKPLCHGPFLRGSIPPAPATSICSSKPPFSRLHSAAWSRKRTASTDANGRLTGSIAGPFDVTGNHVLRSLQPFETDHGDRGGLNLAMLYAAVREGVDLLPGDGATFSARSPRPDRLSAMAPTLFCYPGHWTVFADPLEEIPHTGFTDIPSSQIRRHAARPGSLRYRGRAAAHRRPLYLSAVGCDK